MANAAHMAVTNARALAGRRPAVDLRGLSSAGLVLCPREGEEEGCWAAGVLGSLCLHMRAGSSLPAELGAQPCRTLLRPVVPLLEAAFPLCAAGPYPFLSVRIAPPCWSSEGWPWWSLHLAPTSGVSWRAATAEPSAGTGCAVTASPVPPAEPGRPALGSWEGVDGAEKHLEGVSCHSTFVL